MYILKDKLTINFLLVFLFILFFPYKEFEHYAIKIFVIFFTPIFFLFFSNWKINKNDFFLLFFIFANILSYIANLNFRKFSIDYSIYLLLILLNIFFIYKIFDYLINKINLSFDKLINYIFIILFIFIFLDNIFAVLIHYYAWQDNMSILTYQLERFEYFANHNSAVLNILYIFPISYLLLNWNKTNNKIKVFALIFLMLVLLSFTLSFSRLSIFLFFLNIILIIFLNFRNFKKFKLNLILLLIIFFLILISSNYFFFNIPIKESFSNSLEHRVSIIKNFILLINDFNIYEIIFGKGIGYINNIYLLSIVADNDYLRSSTHNIIVTIFFETGLIGIISLVYLMIQIFLNIHTIKTFKNIKYSYYMLYLNFFVLNLFHSDLVRMLIPFSIFLVYYSISKSFLNNQNIK